jgi:hypothetical protein
LNAAFLKVLIINIVLSPSHPPAGGWDGIDRSSASNARLQSQFYYICLTVEAELQVVLSQAGAWDRDKNRDMPSFGNLACLNSLLRFIRQHLLDRLFIPFVNLCFFSKIALPLPVFLGKNMSLAGFSSLYFTRAGNFKALLGSAV